MKGTGGPVARIAPRRLWHFLQRCKGRRREWGGGTAGSELQHWSSGFCSSERQRVVLGSLLHGCGEGNRGGVRPMGNLFFTPRSKVTVCCHRLLQKQVPIKKTWAGWEETNGKCCCQFQTPKLWEQTLDEGGLQAHGRKLLKTAPLIVAALRSLFSIFFAAMNTMHIIYRNR